MDSLTDCAKVLLVERVKSPEDWSSFVSEWEMLDRATYPRSPFTSPAWIKLWWRHFRRSSVLFRDCFFGHVVHDGNGRLVAIVPLMLTVVPPLGPPLLRIVQFFGTDPSMTEFRGVICRPEDHKPVIEAVAEHFLRRAQAWDIFRWNGLRLSEDNYLLPPGSGALTHRREITDYIMDLPPDFEQIRARVSSNMRKNLRKAYEFLERDKVEFKFRVVENPGDNPSAVETFLRLHAARSNAADMIVHPNKFNKPHILAFLYDYLRVRTATSEPLIFEIEIDGTVVASRLAFIMESDIYLYFAGYDTKWRDYSIMTVLSVEVTKWAISRGLQRLNLSAGSDQSKLRWKPTEIVVRDALQVAPTRRARYVHQAFLLYEQWAQHRAKRNMPKTTGK